MSDPAIGWLIQRNCSASPRQLAAAFAGLAAASLLIGAAFAAAGLWLVLPFVGIELAALAAAFVCYGRHAGDCERIEVDAKQIRVERHEGAAVTTERLDAAWARVEVDRRGRGPWHRTQVFVVACGRRVEVGRCLPERSRPVLARSLRQALQRTGAARG